MIKLPKTIKIGIHEYKVVYPFVFKEMSDMFGQAHLIENKIYLSDNFQGRPLSDSCLVTNLIHEILHIIDNKSGHKVFETNGEWNEDAINAWSEYLCMVFVDNPALLKLFQE